MEEHKAFLPMVLQPSFQEQQRMHYGEGMLSGTSNPDSWAGLSNSLSHGLCWWEWETRSLPQPCLKPHLISPLVAKL